jgi:peptide/nickel transport system substrate-binding protein
MTARTGALLIGSLVALAAVAASAGPQHARAARDGSQGSAVRGGVYRTAATTMSIIDNLDPTGENNPYLSYELLAAMQKTLVGFNGAGGLAGTRLVPQLATSIPRPTNNGLTYTFHLRPNVMFGPPLHRAVTSKDVAYAFQRMNYGALVASYGYYYNGLIKGMTGTAKSLTTPVSGISTPDAHTIVFHLTRRQGDFLLLLSLPATAPIPPEVGKCFTKPGTYGNDLISSGPYMIQGSGSVNVSSCAAIKPMSGYNSSTHITLVRNPNYVRVAGDPPNFIDGFQLTVDPNVSDVFDKAQRGEIDGTIADTPPPIVVREHVNTPAFHSAPQYLSESITMNLTVPPFTDVHVRKAVQWVLDKTSMITALGGKAVVSPAGHINPAGFPGSLPASYDPYATPGGNGSLTKAQAEMRKSAYDANHDGKCDADACKNIVFLNKPSYAAIDPIVQTDLAKIGIQIQPRVLQDHAAFLALFNVKGRVPMSALGGGGTDYTGANSFAGPNYASSAITGPSSCCNYALVGLTKEQAKKYGVPYPKGGIPSVDALINRCALLAGSEQNSCYEKLDATMMTKVAAWAPYMWGRYIVITAPTTSRFVVNPMTATVSIRQVAVSNKVHLNP